MLEYYKYMLPELVSVERFVDFFSEQLKEKYTVFPIYIWGNGRYGKICAKLLEEADLIVKCIIDNNAVDCNESSDYDEKTPIVKPDDNLFSCCDSAYLIIASTNSEREIDAQVRSLVKNKRIEISSFSMVAIEIIRRYLFMHGMVNEEEILRIDKNNNLFFWGDYLSWEDAIVQAEEVSGIKAGYSTDAIYETTVKWYKERVRLSEERDLLFEGPDNFECLSSLLYVMQEVGKLNLLDFGGSLGNTYYKYKGLLDKDKINWNIVEQEEYVRFGKENIKELSFWGDVDECLENQKINCVLFSGSIQYVKSPFAVMKHIFDSDVEYAIFDRIPLCINTESKIVNQNVPSRIYCATYPLWLINLEQLICFMKENGYEKIYMWKKNEFIEWRVDGHSTEQPFYYGGVFRKRS